MFWVGFFVYQGYSIIVGIGNLYIRFFFVGTQIKIRDYFKKKQMVTISKLKYYQVDCSVN